MRVSVLLGTILLVSVQAYAANNCRISSVVYSDRARCELYTARFEVIDQEACIELAKATRAGSFFSVLDAKHERVIKTTMKFKGAEKPEFKDFLFEHNADLCQSVGG